MKSLDAGYPDSPWAISFQTARRFLPLARRLLITILPCLVDMRTRKPWVRALFFLLG
jgi:hypothetical protein